MKKASLRPLAFVLGACLLPLLASLVIGLAAQGTPTRQSTIRADYAAASETGLPDLLKGQAPPKMELAAYLNGRLLDVTTADADGNYELILPVLPPRRSELAVLPTELDASTLALLYDPYGFDRLTVPPADLFLEAPFVAAVIREEGGLQLYGSAIPFTQLDIYADDCADANPRVTVTPDNEIDRIDDEGSFRALLPFAADAPLPARYCIRVTPVDNPSAAETYVTAAPVEGLSRAQSKDPARGGEAWKRAIEFQFTASTARLVFSVEMPADYLVYKNLARGGMSELQFIEYVFGEVSLNTYLDPRKLAWRQEKDADSQRVRVLVESQPLEFLIPEDTATTFLLNTNPVRDTCAPPYGTDDSVIVTLDGVHVTETNPPATSGDASTQTWRGILPETPRFTLMVSRAPHPPADPIGRKNLLNTLADKITKLNIVPSEFLRETLEGQIVDVLPARAPAEAQAQVYDYFRAVYRDDPLVDEAAAGQTFQSLLQGLPGRVPGWLAGLLFGSIWLIPSVLALWALRSAEDPSAPAVRADLTLLASGVFALTVLGLDWFDALTHLHLRWNTYLDWQAAGGLVFLLLFLPIPRWNRWLFARGGRPWWVALAAALPAAGAAHLLLLSLPDGWASALLTALPLLGFACLLWLALNIGKENRRMPSLSLSLLALTVIVLVSLPVQSLPLATQLSGLIGVSAEGAALARPLLSLALLVGVVAALRRGFDEPLGTTLRPLVRGLGRVILVGFAVGLTPAWGFLPLSVLGGLVLFEWILPRQPIVDPETGADFAKSNRKQGIADMLQLNRQMRLWRAAESNAQKLARENKLDEEKQKADREKHEAERLSLEQPAYLKSDAHTLRDLAFNFGAGESHWDNLKNALAWGLILAAPLVILQGWPLVSDTIAKAGTFPFLSTGVRLAVLTGQYLAAAAFLGYFFPYLRGRSGLEKGGWLSAIVILSLVPYHLVYADTPIEWLVIAIWGGSILAYNLLISLLAFDVRTLLHFKFGLARLPDLYDFGELAAYLTGSSAPLVTTIFTAVTNKMDQWVPALLNVVFPSFTMNEAQSQLLQVLIDIANRIASSLLH